MNTTHSLGVEAYLEQRFPTNVVLSLVSGADISQLGASEFEHKGATDIWVGAANKNVAIPAQIQSDMAEALAMTLKSGQVHCTVSTNIRQQQYERMIGYVLHLLVFRHCLIHYSPIAFQPASVLFETPDHAELLEKVGVRALVTGVIDELLALSQAQNCSFPDDFRETTIRRMTQPQENNSTMWMDFEARRPMEIETYLGSPLKLALEAKVSVPRIETLYAALHHVNIVNRNRPSILPGSLVSHAGHPPPPSRLVSAPLPRGPPGPGGPGPMMNGNGSIKGGPRSGSRAPSINGGPPMMRRGPPPGSTNGGSMNGYPQRMHSAPNGQGRPSLEGDNLEEFSHLMLYDDVAEGGTPNGNHEGAGNSSNNLALRERELMLRQRELQLREQEMNMRRGPMPGPGPRGRPPPPPSMGGYDDDDDEDDYFDPMGSRAPAIDPDNFDMMSVTSRRNRKAPSASQIRKNPEMVAYGAGGNTRSRNPFSRPSMNKNRSSARMMADVPGLHDSIMNNPLLGYSSNRYGDVDRGAMGAQSRTNSLTAARLDEIQGGGNYGGAYPSMSRRTSASPGNALSPGPGPRPMGRPSPPNSHGPNGMPPSGRPSPPGTRQMVPRHGPGLGNAVGPQQVEQHAGVSTLYPPKSHAQVSLTGSSNASADNSENSAHSSQSSLGPRPTLGVR